MPKLSTPVMYQRKLSGLAESFPLSLQDEGRQVIGLPVCDPQPAGDNPPVAGRFLQGTQQGGLLRHRIDDLTNVVDKSTALGGGISEITIDFERTVENVSARITPQDIMLLGAWQDPTYSWNIVTMAEDTWYNWHFRGRYISFRIVFTDPGTLDLFGFYQ